ncbi:hypothetical protein [Geomonas limicola]|uniref:hypothetical protein n=1 Tax=Geomonas limicola TaxID=2740186 RepID=UPI0016084C69|nr:hypothetical protein [Geomonas limicola]
MRLPAELSKKLQAEARKRGQNSGENVTVSDLIRGCIVENFRPRKSSDGDHDAVLAELKEEMFLLREHQAQLALELQALVRKLSELFPQLSTREQVDALTDGIAAVIRSLRGR